MKKKQLYILVPSHPRRSTDNPEITCTAAFTPFDKSGEWQLWLSEDVILCGWGLQK